MYARGTKYINNFKRIINMNNFNIRRTLLYSRIRNNVSNNITPNTNHNSDSYHIIKDNYLAYERMFMNKLALRDKNKTRWIIGGAVTVASCVVFSYEKLKRQFGKETAQVATITLQQNELKVQADALAKEIVSSVLNDKKTYDEGVKYSKQIVYALANDEETQTNLILLLNKLYEYESFKIKTRQFVLDIIMEEEFLKQVQNQTKIILEKSIIEILNSVETKTEAKENLKDIFKDQEFQKELSGCASAIVRKMFVPKFLGG